jgi:undecaprenyl diphosphate synthase
VGNDVDNKVMQHLALIMDGNRRWAKKQGLAAVVGHKYGLEKIKIIINFCLKKGIPYVSLYTFSLENFKRSDEEKSYLFTILAQEAEKGAREFIEQGVRIRLIGDRVFFPESVRAGFERLEHDTAHLNRLTVNILFCYGGQQEIVAGVKSVVQKVQRGELSLDLLDEKRFGEELWSGNMPAPDLIVRTGGEQRLSNFMLYQAAYSEFVFLDCFWPELSENDLERVYEEFLLRKRRFGK